MTPPRTGTTPRRRLDVFDKHQLIIAKRTLELSDAGALILGGMTKAEARDIIRRLTGTTPPTKEG